MDYYAAIASQPAGLERSGANVYAFLEASDLEPWRGGLIAVACMGASWHAAYTLVDRLVCQGKRAVSVGASELARFASHVAFADSYVFASEGGHSRETIDAARCVGSGCRLGLTNDTTSPFAQNVDVLVSLDHGEDSRVSTIGYTATVQAFGLLAAALEGSLAKEDTAQLADQVAAILEWPRGKTSAVAERFSALTSVDFVGQGCSFASASESALLFRESTRATTAAYDTHQYLHGPMESLDKKRGCVLFGVDLEVRLAHYLAGQGVPTVLVTSEVVAEDEGLSVLHIPWSRQTNRAVLEVVPMQLVAGELARARGLGIDRFLYHFDGNAGPALVSTDGAGSL